MTAQATEAAASGPPPRQPTFLARYPRKLKVVVTLLVVFLLTLPFYGSPQKVAQKIAKHQNAVHSAERMAEEKTATAPAPRGGRAGPAVGDVTNSQDDHTIKMTPAPDPGLTEDSPIGSLPRVGDDGREPWQVYARPFNTSDPRPRLAIVIVDDGLARLASDASIDQMPTNVTLAFDAQSPVAGAWITRARQNGHEALLMVPMEPFDYPRSDPGSNTLLTNLPNTDNIERLLASLREGAGYVGITTLTGSRFTTDPEKMKPVLEILKARGLMIFDARVAPHSVVMDMAYDMHVPAAAQTERIDQDLSPEGLDKALEQLEKDTLLNGRAIGVAAPDPLVLDKLQAWIKDLPSRGIALAPVSAMVQ